MEMAIEITAFIFSDFIFCYFRVAFDSIYIRIQSQKKIEGSMHAWGSKNRAEHHWSDLKY